MTAKLIIKNLVEDLRNRKHKFVLPNIFIDFWECDVFSVSTSGYTQEFEVKITKEDFYKDFDKQLHECWGKPGKMKHDEIRNGNRMNKFWFVYPKDMIDISEVPDYAGIYHIVKIDEERYAFHFVREAKFLHKRKFIDSPKLLEAIGLKCYYKLINEETK